ncbi:MAG: aminopeptidase P family protein [Clostridiales bacterium]|nr:aminopeptidase P family protein [Clostridiales bacterium]
MDYYDVQKMAKETIEYARKHIHSGMTLKAIRNLCENKLIELGADSFWYWDIGAFVFSGDETALSVSGTQYVTSERIIEDNDIITIDLSPQYKDIWGDYARTLIVQDSVVVSTEEINNIEWKNGILTEHILHNKMKQFVSIETTFEELYFYMNQVIEDLGYINLDFLGNLGHSIVKKKDDRIYIEKGNRQHLGDVSFFTFEPHISLPNSKFGYKCENIYYFNNGELCEL